MTGDLPAIGWREICLHRDDGIFPWNGISGYFPAMHPAAVPAQRSAVLRARLQVLIPVLLPFPAMHPAAVPAQRSAVLRARLQVLIPVLLPVSARARDPVLRLALGQPFSKQLLDLIVSATPSASAFGSLGRQILRGRKLQ